MGEIADMMLEGAMCQWCGEFLENAAGFPTICRGCQGQHGVNAHGEPTKKRRKKKNRSKPRGLSAADEPCSEGVTPNPPEVS